MVAVGEEATKTAAIFTDGLITISTADKSKKILDNLDSIHWLMMKNPNTMEKIGKPKILHPPKTMMKPSNLVVYRELHR